MGTDEHLCFFWLRGRWRKKCYVSKLGILLFISVSTILNKKFEKSETIIHVS